MPSHSRSIRTRRTHSSSLRPTALAVVGLIAGSLLAALPSSAQAVVVPAAPVPASLSTVDPGAAPVPVRITQANLLAGQPLRKFKKDLGRVFAGSPDFITYNEVPYRSDDLLAPEGYDLYRSTSNRYSRTTPVAWRSDRWSPQAQGTLQLSNRKGRLPGRKVEWGIRYANWVTLEGVDGEQISVVSVHLPPKHESTEGLAAQSIRRLGRLAEKLQASGPVVFGGDFNMHYPSRDYLRNRLTEAGLTPTYDVLGSFEPTGDHRGATIDYVFLSPVSGFDVVGQKTTELHSDHDALTADLTFIPTGADRVRFEKGPRSNQPAGTRDERRAVLDLMATAIDNAPRGAGVHLVTKRLMDGKIYRAVREAIERGVSVQFITRSRWLNRKEQTLLRQLGGRVKTRSFAVQCSGPCRRIERKGRLAATSLMVSNSGATRALRIDSDRAASFRTAKSPTQARVWTNKRSYDYMFNLFLKLVRRSL